MKTWFASATWALLLPAACLSLSCLAAPRATVQMSVTLAHNSPDEQKTQAQLAALLNKYDVSTWIRTRQIIIKEKEIPHSHPVLTLNTRHLDRDDLLLSTFVHEQIHWAIDAKPAPLAAAIKELKARYPVLPVGYPKGASDAQGNYEHLIIIYLEDQANRQLLGRQGARKVMQHWATDHYTALVDIVVKDNAGIAAIVKKHGLLL